MNFDAYIFDLDGTVLDSAGVWKQIDIEFLGKRGLPLTDDYTAAVSALRLYDAAIYTAKRFALNEKPEDITAEWLSMAKDKFVHYIGLKPYAKEYILQLRSIGKPVGVATGAERELYVPALERNGLLDKFDVIIDAETAKTDKNSPDIFLKTACALGAAPQKSVVFEDTPTGLRSARSAGFFTVGILDPSEAETNAEIEKIADITACDFRKFLKDGQ